jgi:hypothetical protein
MSASISQKLLAFISGVGLHFMRRLSRRPPPFLPVILWTIDSDLLYIMVARNRNTIGPPQLPLSLHTLSQMFFNFRNICVSVAVFRNILQNMTKDRDTYTYITEIEKNLGECRRAALSTNSKGTQSAHKGKRRGGGRSRNYSHVYGRGWR